jgi:hypothetical protein
MPSNFHVFFYKVKCHFFRLVSSEKSVKCPLLPSLRNGEDPGHSSRLRAA